MLAKEPEGWDPGPGVAAVGEQPGWRGGECAPRAGEAGSGGEEGAMRWAPGLLSPPPKGCENRPGAGGGRRHKVSRDHVRAGPRPSGAARAPGSGRRQVPPARPPAAPCPLPEPAGPIPARPGSQLTLFPPALLPASAGYPARARPSFSPPPAPGAGRAHAPCAPPPSPQAGRALRAGAGPRR